MIRSSSSHLKYRIQRSKVAKQKNIPVLTVIICEENSRNINLFVRNSFIKCALHKKVGKNGSSLFRVGNFHSSSKY
jgi:hypothetical protein